MNKYQEITKDEIKEESPLDLNSVGISDNFDDQIDTEEVFKVVKLGKPEGNDFFKLFPPTPYDLNSFTKGIVTTQRDAKNIKKQFLVTGSLAFKMEVLKRLKPSSKTIITYGISSTKRPFIWCVNYNDNYSNDWQKSAKECAIDACTYWMQIQSDKPNEINKIVKPSGQDAFPVIEIKKYPTYIKAIELAFEGRLISSNKDYAFKKAIGEII